MPTYNLLSTPGLFSPGLDDWAKAGYRGGDFGVVEIIRAAFDLPTSVVVGVLAGELPTARDGETLVITALNKQEVFDKAARHLLDQNAKAVNGPQCAYRGEGERKCAVGALIADDKYQSSLEGLTIRGTSGNYATDPLCRALANSGVDMREEGMRNLLIELQRVHDLSMPINWRSRLATVAAYLHLSPEVLA